MPYPPMMVQPMREELTRLGFRELTTPEDVDRAVVEASEPMLLVVNSVCGCAAGVARPGVALSLKNPAALYAEEDGRRRFLSALFEGDGWIDPTSTVGLGTASEQLAREVQLLLYGFGIPATVASKWNETYQRDYWTVTVNPISRWSILQPTCASARVNAWRLICLQSAKPISSVAASTRRRRACSRRSNGLRAFRKPIASSLPAMRIWAGSTKRERSSGGCAPSRLP